MTYTVADAMEAAEREATAQKDRTRRLLDAVADFTRPCRACAAPLWFVRTRSAKLMPYDADGSPHWATCTSAAAFRARKPSPPAASPATSNTTDAPRKP